MQQKNREELTNIFKNINNILKNCSYIELLNKHISQNKSHCVDMKSYERIVRKNALDKIKLTNQVQHINDIQTLTDFIKSINQKQRINMFEFLNTDKIFLSQEEIKNLSIEQQPIINHGYHLTETLKDATDSLKEYNKHYLTRFIEKIKIPLSLENEIALEEKNNISDNIKKIRQAQEASSQKLTL